MLETLRLYKDILKAAKSFPSIKREKIIAEIRIGFRTNKDLTNEVEVNKLRGIAIKGLQQLSMYSSLPQSASSWSVDLEKEPIPRPK